MVAMVAFLTAVARLEKRMVWPYGNPEGQPQFSDTSGYSARWMADALKAGFFLLGWAPDLKGPRYKVSYALMISPQRDCFVAIGFGTVFNTPIAGTWVYTFAMDGRMFYSADNQSCIETDVSRNWRSQLVKTFTFTGLLQRHRDLLKHRGVPIRAFTAGREIEELKGLRKEHFQLLLHQGLITFTDVSATHWRYTLRGALKRVVLDYSIGLLRAITFGRIPRSF